MTDCFSSGGSSPILISLNMFISSIFMYSKFLGSTRRQHSWILNLIYSLWFDETGQFDCNNCCWFICWFPNGFWGCWLANILRLCCCWLPVNMLPVCCWLPPKRLACCWVCPAKILGFCWSFLYQGNTGLAVSKKVSALLLLLVSKNRIGGLLLLLVTKIISLWLLLLISSKDACAYRWRINYLQ